MVFCIFSIFFFNLCMVFIQFSLVFMYGSRVSIDFYMVFIVFFRRVHVFLEMHDVQTIKCKCKEVCMHD